MKKERIELNSGGMTLSAIYAAPETSPRATIVGLHGGSYDSSYFDYSRPPNISFLDFAAQSGFAVIAVDRPGYGTATGIDPDQSLFSAQAEILDDAISQIWQNYGGGAGVFLCGHSIGGMISLTIAARETHFPLLGAEVSGMGVVYQPGTPEAMEGLIGDAPTLSFPLEARKNVMYGPPELFHIDAQAEDFEHAQPIPVAELREAFGWPERLLALGPSIKIPVQATLVEFDNIWSSSKEARDKLQSVFTGSPLAEVRYLPLAGHSTHSHFAARAHYHEILGYAELCIVAAQASH